jgi:hypothetical protein
VDALAFTESHAQSLVRVFQGIARRLVVLSSGDVYRANDILFGRAPGAEPKPLILNILQASKSRAIHLSAFANKCFE